MSPAAAPHLALKLPAWRSRLLLLLLLAWFVALAGRALYLQGLNNDFLQQKGESRYSRAIELMPTRGRIVDRNNEQLAISTPVESVAASPADVEMTAEEAKRLARLCRGRAGVPRRGCGSPGSSRRFSWSCSSRGPCVATRGLPRPRSCLPFTSRRA